MGKKANKRKQKQQNQRGYATTSSTPSTSKKNAATKKAGNQKAYPSGAATNNTKSKLVVSSQNHQDLLELLGALDDEDHLLALEQQSTTTWIPPDRFYKKLYHIHDTLNQLGFEFETIKKAVVALGYDISLEASLDWLCLHLSAQDLPPLLTEGTVREQEQTKVAGGDQSLTVVKPTPSTVGETRSAPIQEPEFPPVAATKDDKQGSKQEEETEKGLEEKDKKDAAAKAWILQQYQYEEEDEEAEPDASTPTPTNQSQEQSLVEAKTRELSPNEARLEQLERELKEQEADAYDDASNYMRSKQEIKELQGNVKKLRKQVQGLRKRVEKERAAAEAAAAKDVSTEVPTEGEDDYGGGGGFFSANNNDEEEEGGGFFDSPAPAPSPAIEEREKEPPPPPKDPIIPKDSVPSGWTGKTPRDILQDWCKKEKLRPPKFFKLPFQNGARIKVDTKPEPITLETDNYMGSFDDAQHYLATKVLYQLNPDLPLYRLFPPFYRDLWRSWTDSVQSAIDSQQREDDKALQSKIQQLVDAVPKPKPPQGTPSPSATTTVANGDQEEQPVLESWEDEDETEDAFASLSHKRATAPEQNASKSTADKRKQGTTQKGEKLQKEFLRRTESPAYQTMLEARSALPMYAFREQILETVQHNPVTILCAETGAGKTTQCPQFLLEDKLGKGMGDQTSVICTQPRRVAATSVAERVSEEMAEPTLGQTVGYQIRLEAKRSANTRLLFCTTGVVMRRLQDDPTLKGISHICVDEVHERQYQVDCLLVILRQLLRSSRPDLKVILMSATLDANLFSSFFGGAPVVNVPGRTFPVSTYHLEDLLEATNTLIEENSPYAIREMYGRGATAAIEISTRGGEKRKEVHSLESSGVHLSDVSEDYPEYSVSTRRSMDRVNEEILNYDLIEDVLCLLLVEAQSKDTVLPPEGASLSDGSVLVFLPGFGEIRALSERLEANRCLGNKRRFDVIPMHSTLSPQDQRRAFLKPRTGCRKIILATNIAETSVTIPDVVIVVDAGRVREVRVDKRTSTSRLVTDWCSRASAKQRAGRAGRVQPGICLKLYSSKTATVTMHAASQPEIRRVPLEDVCISILAGSFANNCMEFLNQTPQPPAEEAVRSALRILHDVGAITLVPNERTGKASEQLTPLGRHLARLPVDVRLGKMLIFGALFKVIDPVLTVAASLSCKSPFSAFVNDALQAKAKHKQFAHDQSDFLTLCNVWDAYDWASTEGTSKARKFCRDNYLSFSALREIGDTRRHFMELLFGIGFLDKSALTWTEDSEGKRGHLSKALLCSTYNDNTHNLDVVHSVICAGLYPNVGHLVPNESGSGERRLFHKNEQLYFHSSSVNSSLKTTHRYPTSWIAFHEKFGTQHRVSVSTTCFVHPFAILMFGGDLVVQHTNRKVVVDDWIELAMAAQTGVMFREVRKQVDKLLQGFLEIGKSSKNDNSSRERHQGVVDGVVRLLSTA